MCHRARRHTPSAWLYFPGLEKLSWEKYTPFPQCSSVQPPVLFCFYRLDTVSGPRPAPSGERLFPRRRTGALPARAAPLPACTAPTTMLGLKLRRQRSGSRLSAPGGPESAAVRAGPGRDTGTGTHCGEMSKRTSLSSHSTSSAPLMAATRPAESARRPGNGECGGRGWCLAPPRRPGLAAAPHVGSARALPPPWLRPRLA